MDLSVHWINQRGIGPNCPSAYCWNEETNNLTHQNLLTGNPYTPHPPSLVIWAMAHLCHIILVEDANDLCTQNFNPALLEKYGPPYLNNYTYGHYADWLVHRLVESMDFLVDNFWLNPENGFRDANGLEPGAINQQSSFGAALFYLGHLSNINPCFAYQGYYSGLQSYLDKAAAIAELFTNPFWICDFYLNGMLKTCLPNTCELRSAFNYHNLTDSYWWYIEGYGVERNSCLTFNVVDKEDWFDLASNPNQNGVRFFEDISHAVRTLYFPIVCEKNNFSSQGTPLL